MNTQSLAKMAAAVALLTLSANAQTGTPATSGGSKNSGVPAANGAPTPLDVERPSLPSAKIGPGRNDLTPEEQKKQDKLDKARAEQERKAKEDKAAKDKAAASHKKDGAAGSGAQVSTPAAK